MPAVPEHVLVTTGGQQVLELMCRVFVDPDDVVIAEGPTYPGMVPTLMAHQADVRQIDTDADGMRIDLLEDELARLDREGRVPKLIYTIPSFHNPAGVTMSEERRRRLVEIAAARNLVVLEDNPYGRLRFEGGRCRRWPSSTRGAATSSTWAPSRRSWLPGSGWATPWRPRRSSPS